MASTSDLALTNDEMVLDMDANTDYTLNFQTNQCKDVDMDFMSDVSTEGSTNADVGGANTGVTINGSILAKKPINTNEETVGNTNVGIDTSMEKEKYLALSMRRLEVSVYPRIVLVFVSL